jgi:hypothetical protein
MSSSYKRERSQTVSKIHFLCPMIPKSGYVGVVKNTFRTWIAVTDSPNSLGFFTFRNTYFAASILVIEHEIGSNPKTSWSVALCTNHTIGATAIRHTEYGQIQMPLWTPPLRLRWLPPNPLLDVPVSQLQWL